MKQPILIIIQSVQNFLQVNNTKWGGDIFTIWNIGYLYIRYPSINNIVLNNPYYFENIVLKTT